MKENFKKKVLKNGMTVLFEKRDVPVVSVIFATRMGSNFEEMSEKGISHFIEHMLYKGTPTRNNKQLSEELENNGGELSGFTGEDITGYWCKMPSDKLSIALDVLGDMVRNPLFDKEELEKERKVIFEEIKMRKDNPQIHVFDEFQKNLFGGVMDLDAIGTIETMNSIDRLKLVEAFKKGYSPNNMILSVVGDVDFEEVIKYVEDNFGEEKEEISLKEIILKNESSTEKRKGIGQANLVFGYHSPLAGDDSNFTATILSTIMTGGMSSRLFSEIREKRNLAYGILGGLESHKGHSYTYIYVGTMPENVEKVKGLILEEFKKVAEGLTQEELEGVKNKLAGNHQIHMEGSQNQMLNLLVSEIQTKAEDFYDFEENIMKVKLEDVKEMASTVKEGNYSFFALVPGDE